MSSRRRTEHVYRDDLEALDFVARFGLVPRTAMAKRTGDARVCVIERERRLRDAGLIDVRYGEWDGDTLLACTQEGLRFGGRPELGVPSLSPAGAHHESMVVEIAAALERLGQRTLSQREIAAQERATGIRSFSASLGEGRFQRPDMVRVTDAGPPEAIEVKLNPEAGERLEELMRGWRRAVVERRFAWVTYRCSSHALAAVEGAVERTGTEAFVTVRELFG